MHGPILKGKKVILKPMGIKDAPNFVKWFHDKEVVRFLGNQNKNITLAKEKAYIRGVPKDKNKISWSIYAKNGMLIGSTDLHSINKDHKRAEYGILIGDKNYWNKGYGTDTLKTVLKYFFNTLKMNRFELTVFEGNIGGLKCYTKCNLRLEGTRRQMIYRDNKYLDGIIMGLLKDEYKKIKK